ncbi:hypothetical protein [Facklamia sp. P12955]|uniref:hypothetical protein n=1 Tax=Facklamia sp. P12955 TaxID=3421946 RepID=UPI003D16B8FC
MNNIKVSIASSFVKRRLKLLHEREMARVSFLLVQYLMNMIMIVFLMIIVKITDIIF